MKDSKELMRVLVGNDEIVVRSPELLWVIGVT